MLSTSTRLVFSPTRRSRCPRWPSCRRGPRSARRSSSSPPASRRSTARSTRPRRLTARTACKPSSPLTSRSFPPPLPAFCLHHAVHRGPAVVRPHHRHDQRRRAGEFDERGGVRDVPAGVQIRRLGHCQCDGNGALRDHFHHHPGPALGQPTGRRRRLMAVRNKRVRTPWLSYTLVAVGGILMALPFFHILFNSLHTPGEYGILPYHFLPQNFTWSNYSAAFDQLQLGQLFMNSVLVTLVVTTSVLITSAMAGYALAKLHFRGRDVIFRFILATMMLPPFLLLIPDFLIMLNWPLVGGNNILVQGGDGGMTTNIMSLMLPFLVSGFAIFLMRQFMVGIPNEMLEAARIDGAGEWPLFYHIVLPQAKPVAITLGLTTFA